MFPNERKGHDNENGKGFERINEIRWIQTKIRRNKLCAFLQGKIDDCEMQLTISVTGRMPSEVVRCILKQIFWRLNFEAESIIAQLNYI